jgi:nitric oxide dioxygenase
MSSDTTPAPDAPLDAAQIALVRETFDLVVPIADTAAALIYQRIFELAPGARTMFGDDLAAQGRHLMDAIATVVRLLDRPDRLMPVLANLGERHVAYGVEPAHFDVVGQAVLWALEQGLGEAFTPAVHDAWAAAYGAIADGMLAGMQRVPANV